jgi:ribonuclease R
LDARGAPYSEAVLERLADQSSVTERRAADAERELVEWKKTRFMATRVGEDFRALIISTSKYGLTVELEELFVEGFVPMDLISGDRYGFEESTRRVIGARSRHAFRVGDRVEARLVRIGTGRRLEFALLVAPRRRK